MAKKLYNQIQDHIRRQISTRELLPGQSLPSERSLGHAFHASQYPVRQAIDELIKEGILHRIPGKGTFVRPDSDRVVKTNKIGVMYSFPDDDFLASYFYAAILGGINARAQTEERRLLLSSFMRNGKSDPTAAVRELETEVDGFIIVDPVYPDIASLEKAAAVTKKPIVAVSYEATIAGVDQVNFDGREDCAKMVRFLYERGHRRIGQLFYRSPFFGENNNPNNRHRQEGYADAMTALGLSRKGYPALQDDIGDIETVRRIMERPDRPTVIMAGHDMHARFLYGQLRELGYRVPEDVAVVGYDGSPEADLLAPALTTVGCPLKEMGMTAVRRVLERSREGADSLPTKIILPSEIIVKQSHTLPQNAS